MEKRVAFYLRCSTNEQDPAYQEEVLRGKLTAESIFIRTYQENESGFKSEEDRPQMKQLLTDVRNGEINCIYATEFTRISRSTLNFLSIVNILNKSKCNLYIAKDSLNTLDDDGNENKMVKIILTVLSQFGEIEAESLKFRMKNGKETSALQQNYTGGNLLYGYSYIDNGKRDKKLIIDEYQKKVVLRIFNEFVINNKSLNKITAELNLENIPTKTKILGMKNTANKKWSAIQVRCILRGKMYIGIKEYKKKEIKLSKDLYYNELWW
jgi:site-specific DNA recombinase